MSKCSCLAYAMMLLNAWFSTGGFLEKLVADGNFTVDHMKMRCPEEDVNLTMGMILW